MKKLVSILLKNMSVSKLIVLVLLGTILMYSCSNKGENTSTNNKTEGNSNGVIGSIFMAPTVEISGTIYYSAYYYFYSADSCFIFYGGTTNGFSKAYTKNESSVVIKFGTDKGDIKYQLLGNQVLKDNGRSFFRVDNFTAAFQSNK